MSLAACKTLAKATKAGAHRLLLSRATWQPVIRHRLAFDSQQHGTINSAPTMLLSLLINALAVSALAPARNRLPVQQRRHQSSGISMRYGRKQLKIRQRFKQCTNQISRRFSRLTG